MQQSLAICARRTRLRPSSSWNPSGSYVLIRNRFPCSNRSYADSKVDLPALDRKWQGIWAAEKMGKNWNELVDEFMELVPEKVHGQKKYILPMFPYPSGDLHLGHLRVYTISDVLARFRRMQGYNVLHPIGWDAFGLPAENAAIERGIDPASWTKANIERMKAQLKTMNGNWDWDREFATCDPSFYKHTQGLFLKLHEHGLAYQAESMVNWDPVDNTVLANEQVNANGCSWRSGAKVEKRLLKQWFFKISEFQQELLDDLEGLAKEGAWPERVLAMQKNWLGKSIGARIKFSVVAYDQDTHAAVEVFTTRPDTLLGVQYVALSSTHPIVQALAKNDAELQAFLDTIPALAADSKVGYLLPQVRAINPMAYDEKTPDATKASLPIYVAPYVLGDYGDGAVMGVPGHDTRDHAFWKHNRYDDPIRIAIAPAPDESTTALKNEPYLHHGHLTSQSGSYAGLTTSEATKKIIDFLESKNLGSAAETWRLRDWLISRQRYWGTPIPIIHCDSCGSVPVPEDELPVKLPPVRGHWMRRKAGNPLEDAHDWINTKCPECGSAAKRDTDTMDTFVDSSWYFMRFADPNNAELPFSQQAADTTLPVDLYIGGVEHAILHLLYARFISKFVAKVGLWPAGSKAKIRGEPFNQVLTQGMVHGKTYSDPSNGRFLKPDQLDLSNPANPVVISTGETAAVSFEKMSKSKYNGVDPGTCMAKYGADATRSHMLFQAPVSEVLEWDEEKISGITRWLRRLHEHVDLKHHRTLPTSVTQQLEPPRSFFLAKARDYECTQPFNPESDNFSYIDEYSYQVFKKALVEGKMKECWPFYLDIFKRRFEADMKLWRMVQATITSVTESYGKTYSLNTVISDLMALSNGIVDHRNLEFSNEKFDRVEANPVLNLHATNALIQMMAPITPAFAEECWAMLHRPEATFFEKFFKLTLPGALGPHSPISNFLRPKHRCPSVGSVFNYPFPTLDGTYDMLAPRTQPCAVQINGKLRVVVDIPIPDTKMASKNLEKWMIDEIMSTKEGKEKLQGAGKGKVDIRKAKKVIVVKGGKTVNFVL